MHFYGFAAYFPYQHWRSTTFIVLILLKKNVNIKFNITYIQERSKKRKKRVLGHEMGKSNSNNLNENSIFMVGAAPATSARICTMTD